MRTSRAFSLLAAGLLAASQSLLAAAPKADVRAASLVAALQAVSPDPLGGRLGLEVSAASARPLPKASDARNYAVQSSRAEDDQRTYLLWKNSQKS